MKLIKGELKDKILKDVHIKVLKHAPWDTPVYKQIRKNIGWWNDNDGLFRLKIRNPKLNIRRNLDETN